MDQIELTASNREILGKKVRFLRRQGIIPLHLFGHGIESVALQCDITTIQRVLSEAGKTRLISVKVDNEKGPRTVVAREIQTEPQTGALLHADFYQVKMAERIKIEVPVVLVGEAPALKSKENTLVHELNTLHVECLPAKIPANVELDITSLIEPEQAMRVKDIVLDEEITVLSDPELMVARISSRLIEQIDEEEEVPVEAAVETTGAASSREEKSKEE